MLLMTGEITRSMSTESMSTDNKKTIQIFTFNNFFSTNPFGFSLLAITRIQA